MSTLGSHSEFPGNVPPAKTSVRPPSFLAPVLNLFSSIWLGVILLTLLFVYSSIGSSGVPTTINIFDPAAWVSVRQLRPFELTEFEWFNWWPFDLLIVLICINLVVATLRRIPLNAVNLGVWLIHTGIIILCLGSLWYFSTKVEGDSPVLRRRLMIEGPNGERASVPAQLGASAAIGQGDDRYTLQVTNIDPRWELLSGDEKGMRAYKVTVTVQGKTGMFMRDLIANRPQYTQDIIQTDDPNQPMKRAINVIGKPLVDEALKVSLDYNPQTWFYLMDSRAVYLREVDTNGNPKSAWIQRRIHGLPRYNDYIADAADIWTSDLQPLPPAPIRVAVPSQDANDPLPGVTLNVSRYLRYATLGARWRNDSAGAVNPRIMVSIATDAGQRERYEMVAFDPMHNGAIEDRFGNRNMMFVWVASQAEREALSRREDAVIKFTFPALGKTVEEKVTATLGADPNLPFKPIEGTEYSYRVESLQDNLNLGSGVDSVAIVQIKGPTRTFTRWVFADPKLTRDLAMADDAAAQHNAQIEKDANIEAVYQKGVYPPAPIVIAAGPGDGDLAMIVTGTTEPARTLMMRVNQPAMIVQGVTLTVERYAPRSVEELRPEIVPREQRDRQMGEMMSMIWLDLPSSTGRGVWLPYHHYAFENADEVLRRFPYRPETVTLADGRRIEMLYSRARLPLPAPVALDEFAVDTHIGGFTGDTSSIMDWQSLVRFRDENGQWLDQQSVRMNKPTEFRGYWYFQAQWDPPEPPRMRGDTGSAGLNYTVLGVGNRNGVEVMLLGCCISVFGMLYAFYAKPLIKRRRQQAVYAQVDSDKLKRAKTESKVSSPPETVGAA